MSKLALLALFSFIFSALASSGQVMLSSPVATEVLQKYVCQSNNCATADFRSFKQLGNHSFFIKPSSSDAKASLISAESKPDEASQKASSPEHEVPEPATLMLFGTGLLGVAFILRRKLFP